ncbi:MAG TPA: hypothetical protein VM368_02395, partial [Flavisolibacter sp.]|nr:hypothetical protein [Flavisolibacter sp.]
MSIRTENKIHFHFKISPIYLPNRNKLKQYIQTMFTKEGRLVDQVNLVFCSDDELLIINRTYL